MANDNKLRSVVAYIAARTTPGKVKLFKLMYLADFTARAQLGRPITGDTYENFEMGPVPQTLWKRFGEITQGCVSVTQVQVGDTISPEQQMHPLATFTPDLTDAERRVLDSVLDEFGNWTGTRLKTFTHQTIPYRATSRGDVVPYGMAGYLRYRPSEEHLRAALEKPEIVAKLTAIARKYEQQAAL